MSLLVAQVTLVSRDGLVFLGLVIYLLLFAAIDWTRFRSIDLCLGYFSRFFYVDCDITGFLEVNFIVVQLENSLQDGFLLMEHLKRVRNASSCGSFKAKNLHVAPSWRMRAASLFGVSPGFRFMSCHKL